MREQNICGMRICRGKQKSTTNPTQTALGLNPGLRGEKPATNHLSHGKAHYFGIRLEDNKHIRERENNAEFSVGWKSVAQSFQRKPLNLFMLHAEYPPL
jgi:hypothetical protein